MFKLLISSLVLGLALGGPTWVWQFRSGGQSNRLLFYKNFSKDSTQSIVGGITAQKGDNPHQCSLKRASHFCGASIISDQWVVTAAHCIDRFAPSSMTLRCGTLTHARGGQDFKIIEKIVHPSWDAMTLDNDIGLLRIMGRLPLGSGDINSIALPAEDEAIPEGSVVTVTGWGYTRERGTLSSTLQSLDVPLMSNDVCQQKYSGINEITDQMFCAGLDEGGKDACQGDSGGPVKLNGKLIGIVSWGNGCARAKFPGVYARVASFRDWIKEMANV